MIAVAMSLVLLGAAVIHAAWGFGIWWPIRDEKRLAQSVVGARGIERMPGAGPTIGVVALFLLGIFWIAMLAGWVTPPLPTGLVRLGGWAMAAIFLLRGIASYLPPIGGAMAEPAFIRLNRIAYGPLILALGLGTLSLLL